MLAQAGRYWVFEFLSTPSARRATAGAQARAVGISQFLSTPSARRATVSPGNTSST